MAPKSRATGVPGVIKSALDVPSTDRGGQLAVYAPRVTIDQLRNIKAVLEKPPKKPDWQLVVLSVCSGVLTCYKIIDGGKFSGLELVVLFAASASAVVSISKFIDQMWATDPHYENALLAINELMKEKEAEAAASRSGPTLPENTNATE